MSRIPMIDLNAQYASIKEEIDATIADTLHRSAFILDDKVRRFEADFAAYCEAPHAVGVGNGTDAIYLALRALGVGLGDEVITTAFTFIGSLEPIGMVGAHPVLVDIDPVTALMDVDAVAAAVTPATRAIIAVHLYGQPVALEPLAALAKKHDLFLIEDSAQAHGARYRGKRVGALSTVGTFSFYPSKNLGAYGDGGAVVTNDEDLANRIAMMRNHGRQEKYLHEFEGVNSRLDALQAGILSVKLKHLDAWNEKRARVARHYSEALVEVPEVSLPKTEDDRESVWHLYVVRVSDRDRVLAQMNAADIGCGVHYPIPLHLQPAYSGLELGVGAFPKSEHFANGCLSLPMYPEMTGGDIERVVEALKRAVRP